MNSAELQNLFDSCRKRNQPVDFFKGVIDYVDYVDLVPVLKTAFDTELFRMNSLYKEVTDMTTISRQKDLDRWSSFLRLFQFKIAFEGFRNPSIHKDRLMSKEAGEIKTVAEASSFLEVDYMIEDFKLLRGESLIGESIYRPNKSEVSGKPYLLDMKQFKVHLDIVHNYLRQKIGAIQAPKDFLRGKKITFDKTKQVIFVDKNPCQIPQGTKESDLAKVMFSKKVGQAIDWSVIYEEITGEDFTQTKKGRKMVVDAKNRLNERIKVFFNTDDEILSWKNNTISRNY